MINNIRRKVAAAIDPDKKEYPIVELKLATAKESNRNYLKLLHERYEKEYGKSASDEEVWTWDRKKLNAIYKEHGEELIDENFYPEHFY